LKVRGNCVCGLSWTGGKRKRYLAQIKIGTIQSHKWEYMKYVITRLMFSNIKRACLRTVGRDRTGALENVFFSTLSTTTPHANFLTEESTFRSQHIKSKQSAIKCYKTTSKYNNLKSTDSSTVHSGSHYSKKLKH
jgi:hypothetical protein